MLAIMLASQVSPYTQALVVIGVGIFSTLMGFGLLPAGMNKKKADAWRKRYGSNFRIGGPLVIIVGLVLLLKAIYWPF